MTKFYSLTIRNRAAAVVFSILIVGAGVMFVTVGLALLAALAIAGTALGAGYAIYRRLRPGRKGVMHEALTAQTPLDPALEIHPTRATIVESRDSGDQ